MRNSLLVILGTTVMMLASDAAWAQDAVKPLRVLIWSGRNNHDWPSTTPVLKKMFDECKRFGPVDVTETPEKLTAADFARYDVVVSNWTPYPATRREWPAETEQAFLDFVRNGGGFVVFHAGACTFQEWPEFQQINGLTWKEAHTSHAAYHRFKVTMDNKDHPIARGLTDFYITDELYQKMVPVPDPKPHLVCSAFSAKEQHGTGANEPMLVCMQMGKGRGANVVLGHDAAAMQNVGFQTLMLRGAEWAATGQVTLPVPPNWPGAEEPAAQKPEK